MIKIKEKRGRYHPKGLSCYQKKFKGLQLLQLNNLKDFESNLIYKLLVLFIFLKLLFNILISFCIYSIISINYFIKKNISCLFIIFYFVSFLKKN